MPDSVRPLFFRSLDGFFAHICDQLLLKRYASLRKTLRVVYLLSMAIHFVPKQARQPLFLIVFLKCFKHRYPLDQVLENFKYSFYGRPSCSRENG